MRFGTIFILSTLFLLTSNTLSFAGGECGAHCHSDFDEDLFADSMDELFPDLDTFRRKYVRPETADTVKQTPDRDEIRRLGAPSLNGMMVDSTEFLERPVSPKGHPIVDSYTPLEPLFIDDEEGFFPAT